MDKQEKEICIECGKPTGNAGMGDGSLYVNHKGPYCDICHGPAIFEDYDRIQEENDRLNIQINGLITERRQLADKVGEHQQENARLIEIAKTLRDNEEQLKHMADMSGVHESWVDLVSDMIAKAKEALKQSQKGGSK